MSKCMSWDRSVGCEGCGGHSGVSGVVYWWAVIHPGLINVF